MGIRFSTTIDLKSDLRSVVSTIARIEGSYMLEEKYIWRFINENGVAMQIEEFDGGVSCSHLKLI